MHRAIGIDPLRSFQEPTKVPIQFRIFTTPKQFLEVNGITGTDIECANCRLLVPKTAPARFCKRRARVVFDGRHASCPCGEVGIGSEQQRCGGVRDSARLGLAEDSGSHDHSAYGSEMRLGDTSYDADIIIAYGIFGWYEGEDVEVTEPTEAGSVLMLARSSASRYTISKQRLPNLHS